MLEYVMQTGEIDRVLSLISRVLDIRITFFDVRDRELAHFHIKKMSPYCRRLRADPAFDRRCILCDRWHMAQARERRVPLVYRCHRGLLEGVVALHDGRGRYLGSLVLGQLRPAGVRPRRQPDPALQRLYARLPHTSEKHMRDIAAMISYIGRYVIQNELVRHQHPDWMQLLERFIREHLDKRITVESLAAVVDRSPSFLTHCFRKSFGLAPMQYVRRKRIERARQMLRDGSTVKQTALALGFYDEFHFSKVFKACLGYPPARERSLRR
jgi:AraC-like DNA-binding protein